MTDTVPSPSQVRHIPAGSFGEYAGENPADGTANREKSIRSGVERSTAVATVERACR